MLSDDLDRFYELMHVLEARAGQGKALGEFSGRSGLPQRGVYFFREPGELRGSNPRVPRIVRVGTHAVSSGSKSTLWSRLRAHRGGRDGGGNHRGSIFRLHVGAALLSNELSPLDPPSNTWLGLYSPRPEIRQSGLWNLNHVQARYDPSFLDTLATLVAATGSH